MIVRSAPIFVAACTPTLGLHSSSRTTNSYSYFAFGSALRSFTASSAELRPPMPLAATPPVNGPMKPTLTLSLAAAAPADAASHAAIRTTAVRFIISCLLVVIEFPGSGARMAGRSRRSGCIRAIVTSPQPSGKQPRLSQPQGLHQQRRLHVVEAAGVRHGGELGERHLDRCGVLVLAGEPATRPQPVRRPIRREVKVQAPRRYARHGPDRADVLHGVEPEPRFLHGFPAATRGRVGGLDDAGDRFQVRLLPRRMERRGAELAHQDGGPPLAVIG